MVVVARLTTLVSSEVLVSPSMAPLMDLYLSFASDPIVNVRVCFCKSLLLLQPSESLRGVLLEVVSSMDSEDCDLREAVDEVKKTWEA